MNEHLGELADKVKEALGTAGQGRSSAALNKAKAVAVRQHGHGSSSVCPVRRSKNCWPRIRNRRFSVARRAVEP